MSETGLHVTHTRTIVRALTWRVIATCTTMVAAFLFSQDLELTLKVGALDASAKLFLYYAHDRVWLMVPWGLKEKKI